MNKKLKIVFFGFLLFVLSSCYVMPTYQPYSNYDPVVIYPLNFWINGIYPNYYYSYRSSNYYRSHGYSYRYRIR